MSSITLTFKDHVLPDVSRLTFFEAPIHDPSVWVYEPRAKNALDHVYVLDAVVATQNGRKELVGGRKQQGVTTVISQTSAKDNLIGWAANMAVDFVKANAERTGAGMYEISGPALEEARKAHTRHKDKAATKGTDTHALVEGYIGMCLVYGGKPLVSDEVLGVTFPQIQPFIEWSIANVDRFLAAEQKLYSETHGYAGTCDFVAIIDGKLTIGDLKTFPKMWSADAFIQCGAYSLAWRELTGESPAQSLIVKMCDPNDERLKKYGGSAFSVYPRYALEEDEDMFLTRLKMYRYNENFVSPKD